MRSFWGMAAVLTLSSLTLLSQDKRSIVLEKADGGSVTTNLIGTIKVNGGSSLNRRWFTVNDSSSPVALTAAGVKPVYNRGSSAASVGSYALVPSGAATARSAVKAVKIIFVIFNLWGDRMRNLALTEVMDIGTGGSVPFEGTWYASETDVQQLYTSLVFVDSVMLADGSIWRADKKTIAAKLDEVQLHVSETGLDPDPPASK